MCSSDLGTTRVVWSANEDRLSATQVRGIGFRDEGAQRWATYIAQTTQMDAETGQGAPYWPYTFNACAVEVQVDTLTGRVEVLDAVFAQNAEKAVNSFLKCNQKRIS